MAMVAEPGLCAFFLVIVPLSLHEAVIEGIPCNKRDGEKRYFSRTLAAENFCLPAGDGIIEKLKINRKRYVSD
jgi:hypothetical protein